MAKGPTMVNELLAHLKEKQGTPTPGKENCAASLEKVFKTTAPKHNEMSCIPSFTMKDKGQLGRLSKQWGSLADRVMASICSDWIAFAKDVSATLGMSKYPLVPHLPFIVKYAGHALAFHHASVQLTAPATTTLAQAEEVSQDMPKKKLVILKKKATPSPTPEPETPTQAVQDTHDSEEGELSLEDLLAFGSTIKG